MCLFFAASRLNISMRKPSMKFLLNCGETPINLSLEGWDCSFKRWCQGGSGLGIGFNCSKASSLRTQMYDQITAELQISKLLDPTHQAQSLQMDWSLKSLRALQMDHEPYTCCNKMYCKQNYGLFMQPWSLTSMMQQQIWWRKCFLGY